MREATPSALRAITSSSLAERLAADVADLQKARLDFLERLGVQRDRVAQGQARRPQLRCLPGGLLDPTRVQTRSC